MKASTLFDEFFESDKTSGVLLISCTIISLLLSNFFLKESYVHLWHLQWAGMRIEQWINEGLMAVFFLLVGLELKREFIAGELSNIKNALLPIVAAIGGVIIPACIFLLFNYGKPTQSGVGIPMATDIAFALSVLSLLGNKVPLSLKIFLTALATIDDLCAIIVIAIFYTGSLSLFNLFISLGLFGLLLILNRLNIKSLIPYLAGGLLMWYFMLHSGVHSTVTGVLLSLAIPSDKNKNNSPSSVLQHRLHKPVAFIILPLFALANTAIVISGGNQIDFQHPASLGIFAGLIIGKPLGIFLFSFLAVKARIGSLPQRTGWSEIFGIGLLGGIGFTISIFISLLAFDQQELINQSKIAVLISSSVSGLLGFLWLKTKIKK